MNHRQTTFLAEYLKSGNATQAAILAGYSEDTAYSQGQRLLKNVEIVKEITEHRQRIMENTDINIEQIVNEIRKLSLNGSTETIRLRAYDMIMKHLGGYVNEKEIIERLSDEQLEKLASDIISNFKNEQNEE